MLDFLYHALRSFRPSFSRHRTWLVFTLLILGFLGSPQITGLTSFCRFWGLGGGGYSTFVHFFRSTGWSLLQLEFYWGLFVLGQNQAIVVNDRVVMPSDHTFTPKDGRKMPGVVAIRQDSETQSKPSYFRGHCWGAITILVGSVTVPFSLPLAMRLHQGFAHLGLEQKQEGHKKTLASRIITMASDFTIAHNVPAVIVLDAFFSVSSVFKKANSLWSIQLKQPLLTVIVRAKKNYVAYFEAEKPIKRRRGRPRKYGLKVRLMELFDHQHLFEKTEARVYGKIEEVSIACVDLLWKPTGGLIRFVFAQTSHGRLVLMCSDLKQDPITALELYSLRIRVELMFSFLKHLLGVFQYHFWSKGMIRHRRRPQKNTELKAPSLKDLPKVIACWRAIECFVLLGCISLGLLQLMSIRFKDTIWGKFSQFLRTRSRDVPSERTTKSVLTHLLLGDFHNVAPSAMMREIRTTFFTGKKEPLREKPPANLESMMAGG